MSSTLWYKVQLYTHNGDVIQAWLVYKENMSSLMAAWLIKRGKKNWAYDQDLHLFISICHIVYV